MSGLPSEWDARWPQRRQAPLMLLLIVLFASLITSCGNFSATTAAHDGKLVQPRESYLDEVQARGVLRIATDANYPPQSFLRLDGTWEGFDIEVGREIARRLDLRVEFIAIPFEQVVYGGWDDRWDVHIGSMTITAERVEHLIFTEPYYYTPAIFAVHTSSSIQAPDELTGSVVGVASATTYESYLSGTLTMDTAIMRPPPANLQLKSYGNEMLAFQDLASGEGMRLDAVLAALPVINEAIRRGTPIRVIGQPVFYEQLAVALDRNAHCDGKPLADAISHIIMDMHADGTLRRLSQQFYGVDVTTKL